MDEPAQPDTAERVIRFGCGAILGLLLFASAVFFAWPLTYRSSLVVGVLSAVLFGWLAVRYGDRFWIGIRKWLWFWSQHQWQVDKFTKVTGVQRGTYSYDPTDDLPGRASVPFALNLRQGWFGRFRGTVNDGGPEGMPGTGHVEGRFSFPRIQFVKWMPASYVTGQDGRNISMRDFLVQNGYPCERDIPHEPIHYYGEFFKPMAAQGVWIIRESKVSVGNGWVFPIPESTGTWSIAFSAA